MHYNISLGVCKKKNISLSVAKKLLFLLKNNIECGDEDGTGIPELVGDENGVQFLIPVEYE